MPFDSFFIRAFSAELEEKLRNGRIERIYHPQKDRIIFEGRHPYPGIDFYLLFSIHPQFARVQLSDKPKDNPKQPSAFCMLLRKHLSGARILSIEPTPWERIITITLEVYASESGLAKRKLILEILGRQSNLILADESGIIIDALKRVYGERQIIPGETYQTPPSPTPWNPQISEAQLQTLIDRSSSDIPLYKFLYTQLLGVSPFIGREIAVRAGYATDIAIGALDSSSGAKLVEAAQEILKELNEAKPCVLLNPTGEVKDFSAFPPRHIDWAIQGMPSLNDALSASIHCWDNASQTMATQNRLQRVVGDKIAKTVAKLNKQKEELAAAEDADQFRLYGELLNFYRKDVVKGQFEISVINYYDPDGPCIRIALRPDLSPNENIQAFYKKYQKAKKGKESIAKQIQSTQEDLAYFEGLFATLGDPLSLTELHEIEEELETSGLIRRSKSEKKSTTPSSPHRFMSSEGIPIDVGRNNQQNDRLTFKIASPRDTWLHTQGIPGSHVLIRDDGQGFNEKTLLEAVHLAAWYSKARNSSKIPVDYTQRRHVRKPPGAHPGFVLYDHVKTVIITPDSEILKKLGVETS